MINAKKTFINLMLVAMALPMLSACGMMTEDEDDCNPYYKVKFRFDMNMLFADAFQTQVEEVDLYVFDTDGKLVWNGHEKGAPLAEDGYLMDLPIKPGTYDFVAWCGKEHEDAAGFSKKSEVPATLEDLEMRMHRGYDNDIAHSSVDLHALFHGKLKAVTLPNSYGTHIITIPLIKDTNVIRIQLVHLSGSEIKADDFDFKIHDSNGYLGHDNAIMDDEIIEYRAWSSKEGLAQTVPPSMDGNSTRTLTEIHSLVAELTTSRLQTCQRPILTISRRSDNEKIIEIPIIDFFLLVKGEYNRHMTDDEFLDRQDEYHMTFFLNENDSWYRNVFEILNWRIVDQSSNI